VVPDHEPVVGAVLLALRGCGTVLTPRWWIRVIRSYHQAEKVYENGHRRRSSTYTPELIEGLIGISAEIAIDEIWLLDYPGQRTEISHRRRPERTHAEKNRTGALLRRTYDARPRCRMRISSFFQFRAGLLQGRIQDEKIPLESA
jgi:hypothetical protein